MASPVWRLARLRIELEMVCPACTRRRGSTQTPPQMRTRLCPAHPGRPGAASETRIARFRATRRLACLRSMRMERGVRITGDYMSPPVRAGHNSRGSQASTSFSSSVMSLTQMLQLRPQPFQRLGVLDEPLVLAGGLAHRFLQLRRLPGLFQEAENMPLIDGRDDRIEIGIPVKSMRTACGCPVRIDLSNSTPVTFGMRLIGHDDVDFVVAHQLQAFLGTAGPEHVELAAQQVVHRVAHVGLVVDDQERVPFCWSSWLGFSVLSRAGERKSRFPRPASLSTSMRPPCADTMWCEIDNPSPVPFADVLGREERIEQARQLVRSDAGAVVGFPAEIVPAGRACGCRCGHRSLAKRLDG